MGKVLERGPEYIKVELSSDEYLELERRVIESESFRSRVLEIIAEREKAPELVCEECDAVITPEWIQYVKEYSGREFQSRNEMPDGFCWSCLQRVKDSP